MVSRLNEIIREVKMKYGVSDSVVISKWIIYQRQKGKIIVDTTQTGGLLSPLLSIEPQIVQILIQMAQICQYITPSEAIMLINLLVKGTQP